MYYLNCFFVYSIIGYFFETIISFISKSGFKSGILYGCWTPVYGIGAVTILLLSNYLFKNLHMNRIIETIIMFFIVSIFLSTMEALGGILIEKVFGKVFWDYSNHKFNIGHYASLEMTLVWGVISILFIYIINPMLKGLIQRVPKFVTIILLVLFLFDMAKTFIEKRNL